MDNLIPDSIRKKFLDRFDEVGVQMLCPRCGGQQFVFIDGYITPVLQTDIHKLSLSGKSLPTVATVCNKCGFVSQHALGPLGLLEEKKEEDNVEPE